MVATVSGFADGALAAEYVPVRDSPPAVAREFRGAWVASVYNIDWPSKPGLPVSRQKSELIAIFDKAVALKMNAIILQVRPGCDALYSSKLEPWSRWLTGTQGKSPGYDPLSFAVAEAHARGLELHAWCNPFRALGAATTKASSTHVTRRHPEWVRKYEGKVWLDPGLAAVRDYSTKVLMDIVRRYDIDGLHIDDYFYPYPKNPAAGYNQFPDLTAFKASGARDRNAWRRANIDAFISNLNREIKAEKPWVKFGISPFGIWKPGVPRGIKADLDNYSMIFGDSKKWLNNGWCDYMSPQLYWPIGGDQDFAKLLPWWDSENKSGRHVWPGLAVDRIGRDRNASEIGKQIGLSRGSRRRSHGHCLWSMKQVMTNNGGIASTLDKSYYTTKALVPAMRHLSAYTPPPPSVRATLSADGLTIDWAVPRGVPVRAFTLQAKKAGTWSTVAVSSASKRGFKLSSRWGTYDAVAVKLVDRYGNISAPVVLGRR
ncbi:MAG: family 10 glycosylhydrolase [Verrucomicrobiota bacterium]